MRSCSSFEIPIPVSLTSTEILSAKAKQRDIQLQLKGQPTHITGNPALIHSVLYNLSDNAITYNRDGGSVNITITDEADKISFFSITF